MSLALIVNTGLLTVVHQCEPGRNTSFECQVKVQTNLFVVFLKCVSHSPILTTITRCEKECKCVCVCVCEYVCVCVVTQAMTSPLKLGSSLEMILVKSSLLF